MKRRELRSGRTLSRHRQARERRGQEGRGESPDGPGLGSDLTAAAGGDGLRPRCESYSATLSWLREAGELRLPACHAPRQQAPPRASCYKRGAGRANSSGDGDVTFGDGDASGLHSSSSPAHAQIALCLWRQEVFSDVTFRNTSWRSPGLSLQPGATDS